MLFRVFLLFLLSPTVFSRPQLEQVEIGPNGAISKSKQQQNQNQQLQHEPKRRPKYTFGMGACPDTACANPPCSPEDCEQNPVVYKLVDRPVPKQPDVLTSNDVKGSDTDHANLKQPQIRITQPKIEVKPPKFTISEPKIEVDPGKISVSQKSKFTVTQPEMSVEQPVVSLKQPRFRIEQQPVIQIIQPKLVLEQPVLSVGQPKLKVKPPQVAISDPGLDVIQPKFKVIQPKVSVEQAKITVTQPEITLNERILKALQTRPEGQRLVRRVQARYVRRLVANPDGTLSVQLVQQAVPVQESHTVRQPNGDLVSEAVIVTAGDQAQEQQTAQIQPQYVYGYAQQPQQYAGYQFVQQPVDAQPLQYQAVQYQYPQQVVNPQDAQAAYAAYQQPAVPYVQYQVPADSQQFAAGYQVAQQPAVQYAQYPVPVDGQQQVAAGYQVVQQPVQYQYQYPQLQQAVAPADGYDVVRLPVYENRPDSYTGDYYDAARGQVVFADGRTQAAHAFKYPPHVQKVQAS